MAHNLIGINFLMCTTYKLHIVIYVISNKLIFKVCMAHNLNLHTEIVGYFYFFYHAEWGIEEKSICHNGK